MKGSALFSLLVALLLILAGCSSAARNLPETPAPTLRPTRTPLGVFPSGAHDGAEKLVTQPSCRAFGWAIDINHPEQPITVRVLADGVEVAQAVADRFRPDLELNMKCPKGACAYAVELWDKVTPNVEHTILVQIRDATQDAWVDAQDSPRALTCLPAE
jgi:hypothetical protein